MTQKKKLSDKIETRKVKPSARRKSYAMDLRVHSPASLGYLGIDGIDTAPAMVRLAKVKGLDMIAVTDYYSGEFVDRVSEAAKEMALTVIPGTVIRCRIDDCDDVMLICLFPEGKGKYDIEDFLLELGLEHEDFGNKDYLVEQSLEDILSEVEEKDGIAIPSRMDKTPNRMKVLPKLVEEYGFRVFDLAYSDTKEYFKTQWPKQKFELYSFSNANALAQVGSRQARVKMQMPGFDGLKSLAARESLRS